MPDKQTQKEHNISRAPLSIRALPSSTTTDFNRKFTERNRTIGIMKSSKGPGDMVPMMLKDYGRCTRRLSLIMEKRSESFRCSNHRSIRFYCGHLIYQIDGIAESCLLMKRNYTTAEHAVSRKAEASHHNGTESNRHSKTIRHPFERKETMSQNRTQKCAGVKTKRLITAYKLRSTNLVFSTCVEAIISGSP